MTDKKKFYIDAGHGIYRKTATVEIVDGKVQFSPRSSELYECHALAAEMLAKGYKPEEVNSSYLREESRGHVYCVEKEKLDAAKAKAEQARKDLINEIVNCRS